MNLELSLKQALKLSPQMLQSMEILQMSTLELNEYIQELVQENPAAELTEPADPGDEGEELWRRRAPLYAAFADGEIDNNGTLAGTLEQIEKEMTKL